MRSKKSRLWGFVEACDRAADFAAVREAFLAETEALGFVHAAIFSQVDPLNPPPLGVVMHRVPQGWVQRYSEQGYQRIDPIHFESRRRATPFRWDRPEFCRGLAPIQTRMINEAMEMGLRGGLSIPVKSPGAIPATCSLFPGVNDFDPKNYLVGHSIAVIAHEHARRLLGAPVGADAPRLTERERQCLTLAARGKSDWAISELLGLSEGAVHKTIERAKRKLGVATRVQAIVRAIHAGEILLADAME
jgi:DNA-binding CsgD family transcriptional regulator